MANKRVVFGCLATLATFFCTALPASAASDSTTVLVRRYTLAELDALAASKSWQELGDHLTDITTTARDAHWESLVEQAAVGELSPLVGNAGSIAARLEMIDRYYPAFPSLAQSQKFLELRATIGLEAFRQCFEASESRGPGKKINPEACRNYLWDFINTKPLNYELASKAAHMVAVKFAQATAAPFFAIATLAPGGEAACKDADLGTAAVAGLGQGPQAPEAKGARFLLKQCWDALQTPVVEAFANEGAGSDYMKNSCPALMAHNALNGLRAKRCEGLEKEG